MEHFICNNQPQFVLLRVFTIEAYFDNASRSKALNWEKFL